MVVTGETECRVLVEWYWQGETEYRVLVEWYWQGETECRVLVEWYWQGETECRVLVEWYWQGETEYRVLLEWYWQGETEYRVLVEWYWRGNRKYWERNLSQCHFVHHKSHMDWTGTEYGWEDCDGTPELTRPISVTIQYSNPVPTSQRAHSVSIMRAKLLILYREIITVYFKKYLLNVNRPT